MITHFATRSDEPTNRAPRQMTFSDIQADLAPLPGFAGPVFRASSGQRFLAEDALIQISLLLGAAHSGGPLSLAEQALVAAERTPGLADVLKDASDEVGELVLRGEDPLGAALCALRSPQVRRQAGAIYTPKALIHPMVDWVLSRSPARIVDAGAGSGRFAAAAALRDHSVPLVAIDTDPLATLIARATLNVVGASNLRVIQGDFTTTDIGWQAGPTAFLGNPPYVRHHGLSPGKKSWAAHAARQLGHSMSLLAGLHVYFFLATALKASPGDIGCFVTSAEWLDVNYGSLVRELLVQQLPAESLTIVAPESMPFEDAATTAVITCFRTGAPPKTVALRQVQRSTDIRQLGTGPSVARERLVEATRWTPLIRASKKPPAGYVELGELCRVHRGAVTGANEVWVTRTNTHNLPNSVLFPSITRARELFEAGSSLDRWDQLAFVVDLPADLDTFHGDELKQIEAFLRAARMAGAADTYVARNRRAWWSIGLRQPAPILATYMARRPPAFVRNRVDARHINIAHGLYPRQPLPDQALTKLAQALSTSVSLNEGRTYAGGLTKFEPKEMERLYVPDLPELLAN